ncbi:Xylosyltransferase 2 [Triticum urartu]|uniref:Xylosyltransferase 2 n=1 Tax=Triticum urartu TaxID=4572 RepID=M7YDZ7_TRIUA|nr:Xylosyltransferase 2 [Triticum urartu]
MGAEHHSPSSAKTSPRGSGVGGGGEQYSPSTKSPRGGAGGGGEHYSASSKSPRAGGIGDVLHVFSTLPRNVNFVEHTSRLGWKEGQRAQPLIVDPGLYASKKQDIFYASGRRELPTAFRLYTGSAWVALTRDFAEYVVWGWDNLPRTLLMYYANFVSSPEGYFQTVLCNAPRFVPTVANHDLHHIQWDVPPRQHPHALTLGDMDRMEEEKCLNVLTDPSITH